MTNYLTMAAIYSAVCALVSTGCIIYSFYAVRKIDRLIKDTIKICEQTIGNES